MKKKKNVVSKIKTKYTCTYLKKLDGVCIPNSMTWTTSKFGDEEVASTRTDSNTIVSGLNGASGE